MDIGQIFFPGELDARGKNLFVFLEKMSALPRFCLGIGGSAANGKTTEALIHLVCFKIYSAKLPKRTFAEDNQKAHKFLIDLITSPIWYACTVV